MASIDLNRRAVVRLVTPAATRPPAWMCDTADMEMTPDQIADAHNLIDDIAYDADPIDEADSDDLYSDRDSVRIQDHQSTDNLP